MNDALAPARVGRRARQSARHRRPQMVRPLADQGVGTPARFLRKTFELPAVERQRSARICALGLYRAFINGERVGNDLLTPGWTSY